MATKREKGRKWEYIIKRAQLLPKLLYFVFDNEEKGNAYVARLEAMLDKGFVPPELIGGEEKIVIAEVIEVQRSFY